MLKKAALIIISGSLVIGCTPIEEKPKPSETVLTGCKGKVKDRLVDVDGSVTIEYYADSKCSKTKTAKLTEEEDLNARCWEGYFPQCVKWWETEQPGVRQPTEPGK